MLGRVALGGREVNRLGLSVTGLAGAGMWGEPRPLDSALAALRRAVELGVELVQVALPFGHSADLVRAAAIPGLAVTVRLTAPISDAGFFASRLGPKVTVVAVTASRHLVGSVRELPVGLVVQGPIPASDEDWSAVEGPWPAPPGVLEFCADRRIPYLTSSLSALGTSDLTIALPAARSMGEVERLLSPPGAGRR